MSKTLLQYTDHDIVISGRDISKAQAFASLLTQQFLGKKIRACFADAIEKNSLIEAFQHIDLAIVTATIPDFMDTVAEAAIATDTDMIDILIRGDVVDTLEKYRETLLIRNRRFITQAGFHPGLAAPVIRYAKSRFDTYREAKVFMAMDAVFEKPASIHEIMYELMESKSRILINGKWKKANYKDALTVSFSDEFGTKKCFSLQMREIYGLEDELGLRNLGVYVAGFGPFIDRIVFPLALFMGVFHKKLGQKVCSWIMFQSVKKHIKKRPRVAFSLQAEGIKDQRKKKYELTIFSNDAFNFTSLAVLACLNQCFNDSTVAPGLYLMGTIVDENKLFPNLKEMGVQIQEVIS